MNSYDDSEPVRANGGGPADPPWPTGANGRAAVGSATVGTGGGEPARAGVGRATVGRAGCPPRRSRALAPTALGVRDPNGANGYRNGESDGYDTATATTTVYAPAVAPSSARRPRSAPHRWALRRPPGERRSGGAVVRPRLSGPSTRLSGRSWRSGRPRRPGGSGRSRRADRSRWLEGRGGPAGKKRSRRRRMINLLVAGFAVFVILAGAGVVGGTYYTTTVVLPDQIDLPLASTIYAVGQQDRSPSVGEVNRTFVTIDQIPDYVQNAVAAAEDRKFYEHSGVDYAGIVRAAWNNFTGGDTQGASTITQQYARNAFDDLEDVTYARKIREAVSRRSSTTSTARTRSCRCTSTRSTSVGARTASRRRRRPTSASRSSKLERRRRRAVLAAVIKQPSRRRPTRASTRGSTCPRRRPAGPT